MWKGWQQPQGDSNRAGVSLKCANGGLAFLVLIIMLGLRAKMPFIQLGSNPKNPEEEGNKRVSKVEPKP